MTELRINARKAERIITQMLCDDTGHASSRCSRVGCEYLPAACDGDADEPVIGLLSDHSKRASGCRRFRDCSGKKAQ